MAGRETASALHERRPALARRLAALSEPAQIVAVLAALLAEQGPDELIVVLDAALEDHGRDRSVLATAVLVAVMDLASSDALKGRAARLSGRARELGLVQAARFLEAPPPLLVEQVRKAQVIRAHDGRPLSLGERKSLARNPGRMQIDRLLADPSPEVVRNLLRSPKLTESDVVRLVSRRPAVPEVLAVVARSRRWVMRYRVRLALVMNPALDPALGIKLSVHLMKQDRVEVARDHTLHPRLRESCARDLEPLVHPVEPEAFDPDVH